MLIHPRTGIRKLSLKRLKNGCTDEGFTWLKMDLGIHQINAVMEDVVNYKYWNENGGGINNWYMGRGYAQGGYTDYWKKEHPFTQVQITDKGLEELARYS